MDRATPNHDNRVRRFLSPGPLSRPQQVFVVLFFIAVVTFGTLTGSYAACDPLVDETCVIPDPVVAVLDERQLGVIVSLLGITAALSLATFVWHASAPFRLKGRRRDS